MAERYQVKGRRIWDSETDTYSILFCEKKRADYWMERLNSNTCVISDDIGWKRLDQWDDNETVEQSANDPVNHPPHYQGKVECIDAIEAALGDDGFVACCRGNAMKYLYRAGRKGELVEDLRKAAWYLERAIKTLEK
jgi:hypothetical protein